MESKQKIYQFLLHYFDRMPTQVLKITLQPSNIPIIITYPDYEPFNWYGIVKFNHSTLLKYF